MEVPELIQHRVSRYTISGGNVVVEGTTEAGSVPEVCGSCPQLEVSLMKLQSIEHGNVI